MELKLNIGAIERGLVHCLLCCESALPLRSCNRRLPLERRIARRASDFEMAVFAANRINRNFFIDAVPGISPHTSFGFQLSRIA